MLPRWVPRANQSSQNSSVKGLLYVPGAVGRGPVLSIVQAQREGSASPTAQGPTRPEEREGQKDWLGGEWEVALGGGEGGCGQDLPWGEPHDPKAWALPLSCRPVLQREELAKILCPPLQPTAGQKRVWAAL